MTTQPPRRLWLWFWFCVLGAVVGVGCGEPTGTGDGGIDICAEVRCDDEDDCTENVCDPGHPLVCIFPDAPEDTPCNEGGVCDGAGRCMECNRDEHCLDDFNECLSPVCDAGTCSTAPLADGTACAGGVCHAGDCALNGSVVPCTEQGIRNAIAAGGGPYAFDCDGPTVVTTVEEITIDNDVVLDGGGNLAVHGNDEHRVFSVLEDVSAEIHGFTVTGGVATREIDDQSCGGLANAGTLTLANCVVSGNAAASGGGGICNSSLLTLINSAVVGNTAKACGGLFNNGLTVLRNSTVSGNTAASGGGGGICSSGPLTLVSSTVSGNSADYSGGIESSGTLMLTNSTVSGNTSEEGSGGIFNIGTATLESGTIVSNTVGGASGDIRNAGALMMTNTLVDGVCIGSAADITSDGHNIESPGDTCGLYRETDQVNVPRQHLQLQPLTDNGGPTMTHALRSDSVAIDRIPEMSCEMEEDQRGVARPQGAACDVGAFELAQEEP